MYKIYFSRKALKDRTLLKAAGLEKRTKALLNVIAENPYQNPPEYEKLIGNLRGYYSRRINIQHRLVYRVNEENKTIDVDSMWSHYGDN